MSLDTVYGALYHLRFLDTVAGSIFLSLSDSLVCLWLWNNLAICVSSETWRCLAHVLLDELCLWDVNDNPSSGMCMPG